MKKSNRGPGRPPRQSALELEPDLETLKEENRQLKQRLKLLDPLAGRVVTVSPRLNLSDKQWKALEFEIKRLTDDWVQTEGWPSKAPAALVAQNAGVSRQTIYEWQSDSEYRRGLYRLVSERRSAGVSAQLKADDNQAKPVAHQPDQMRARIHSFIKRNWRGPVKSPVDGNTYGTVEEFFHHVLENRLVPILEGRCDLCSGHGRPLVRQGHGRHFCLKCAVYTRRFVEQARQDVSDCVIDAPASGPSGL